MIYNSIISFSVLIISLLYSTKSKIQKSGRPKILQSKITGNRCKFHDKWCHNKYSRVKLSCEFRYSKLSIFKVIFFLVVVGVGGCDIQTIALELIKINNEKIN